jgi:hypothetical protein
MDDDAGVMIFAAGAAWNGVRACTETRLTAEALRFQLEAGACIVQSGTAWFPGRGASIRFGRYQLGDAA